MDRKLLAETKKLIGKRKGAHDLSHILRVNALCEKIAKKEKADLEIVSAMTLLHDLIRYEGKKEEESAKCSAKKAKKLLKKLNYNNDEINIIINGIKSHSIHTKAHVVPQSLEAKILFDADKIDATGEIGVARWFMTMAHKNVSVKEAALMYLKEMSELEKKMGGKLFTKTGTKLIRKKLKYSKDFMSILSKKARS